MEEWRMNAIFTRNQNIGRQIVERDAEGCRSKGIREAQKVRE